MRKRSVALILAASMVLGGCSSGKETVSQTTQAPTTAAPATETPTTAPETEAQKETEAAQGSQVSWDEEKQADVIIVGAGGAGLAAAIAAADEGAESIIIVEKLGKTGGSLNFTSGSMSGAETIIQELDGIEDTKESYIEDILSNGAQLGDRELIEIFVDEDVDAIQWLWDHGLSEYTFSEQNGKKSVFAPEHQLYSIQRTYKPKAMDPANYKSAVHEILDKEIAGYDNITIDYYTEITELVGNEKGQVLTAVGYNSDTKKTVAYKADKGIVMATGGYSGNPKMMGKYAEYGENYLVGGADSADGKGIRIMQNAGAAVDEEKLAYIPTFPMGLEYSEGKGAIGDVYMWKAGGIYVNQEGKRFINETLDEVVPRETALEEQTGAVQYNIFTDKIVEDLKAAKAAFMWEYYYEPEQGIGHKLIQSADTLEELAGIIGVPADTLAETVKAYNEAVEAGGTDEFGRDFSGTPTAYSVAVNKIEGDKYYAVPIKALVVMTLGGVTVNHDMQVVDESGNPIPGLYAAGEVVGGIWGRFVSGGTGVMGPVVFGRITGRNVVNLELKEGEPVKAASFVLEESLFEKEEVQTEGYDMSGLKDGTYEATVDGQNGPMTVSVTVADGKLSQVTVVSNQETENIAGPALEKIPAAMVEANSPDVDGVTGATLTSGRIRDGVKACLDQAK
ncbi:MAG: FAD-binding protein [Hungatella sp.]|nr:FAD-binding protein [Hungatella sp.]